MGDKGSREELRAEVERGHFARAALLAEALGLALDKIQDFRTKALWQMSAVGRNAPGTKALSQQYGLSKNQLRQTLQRYAEKKRSEGDKKPLEPCYDHSTGKYLSYEEWVDNFFRKWDRLPGS